MFPHGNLNLGPHDTSDTSPHESVYSGWSPLWESVILEKNYFVMLQMSDMGIFIWQYDLTVGYCFQNHNPLESHNLASVFRAVWNMDVAAHRGASSMSEMQFSV